LANIREVDAIIHVIRCFEDENVVHVDGHIDPVRDKEVIDMELLLKDIETVEKRIEKLKKQAKSGEKDLLKKASLTEEILKEMEKGIPARSIELDESGIDLLNSMMLLTNKPVVYVCNLDDDSVISGNEYTKALTQAVMDEEAEVLMISAGIEAELIELEDEDRKEFLEDMGLSEPGVNQVIRAAYHLLDLITYFTVGDKEVRAWTVRRGAKAPQAAGVIHTDFEKGFIRAEVISFSDYESFGSELAVKEAGHCKVEGKDYVVQDGDVIYFRFNV
jgi:GTP-binding protein YchF